MRASDVIVEVADWSLADWGQIVGAELVVEASVAHNETGQWKLTLPVESAAIPALSLPGSRIIISTASGQFLSGPRMIDDSEQSADDPKGTVTFTGTTDSLILKQRIAYPNPAQPDVTLQTDADWKMTGPVESVMHALVSANVGPNAPESRRDIRLVMGPDLGRGPVVTVAARFEPLHDVLSKVATANAFTFDIVQRDNVLVFETAPMVDRSAEVRLSVAAGSLTSSKVRLSAPGVTHVIVGGEGAANKRKFTEMTTEASLKGQSQWGDRRERYVDAGTGTPEEVKQPALDVLSAESNTGVSTQSVPAEDSGMGFGVDYFVGDQVAVEVDGQEPVAVVSGSILKADAEGVLLGITLGDPLGFDPQARALATVSKAYGKINKVALNEVPFVQINAVDDLTDGWRAPGTEQINGDDALLSPTKPASTYGWSTNFVVTPSWTTKLVKTITVPAGFTIALVNVNARVFAYNDTAAADYLWSKTRIGDAGGIGVPVLANSAAAIGTSGLNPCGLATTQTGLVPGTTFNISIDARTSFGNWGSDAGNTVELWASILWYR